ncbi:MAG: glycoside hydrolase family 127 protein [Clostridia bacterium]|nr:glycoside hydrolase family 127 protein [Clostridia bacterium]
MSRLPMQWIDNNEKNRIPDRLFTPLYGVNLTGGLFERVFRRNAEFLKKISVDAALYWFRRRAGKAAPGQPYRGHFEDNIKGQTAGLLLMGAGNILRWEENAAMRKLVDTLVSEIKACSLPDGYLMAVPEEQFGTLEYPHYVRIWLTYGLWAAALGGNEEAAGMLRRWQDWFNTCDDLPIIRYLTLAFQGVVCSPFVFNTPLGKWEDIDTTVRYYEEDWRLGQFIMREKDAVGTRRQPGVEPHPHGTELEALEGYLDLYRATGKHYYLRAVMEAYEMYRRDWQHVGGGIVLCEYQDSYPGCNWLAPNRAYNELCCSSFWIFLNQRLHRLYPDEERYVAEMEKSIYNVAIANQQGEAGIRYHAWIDGHKQQGGLVHCCCGVGTRLFAMLPEFLYSVAPDALSVDMYAASRFVWRRGAGEVRVRMETDMPYDCAVTLAVETGAPQRFALRLRIPGWTDGDVAVSVGGETYIGAPRSYLVIEREWAGETVLSFRLPFAWRQTCYTGAEERRDLRAEPPVEYSRWALEYGPLLMAVTGGEANPFEREGVILPIDPARYVEALRPAGAPLHFEIEGCAPHTLMPYFEIDGERFSCYPLFPAAQ